ncbi:MAG: hypothetical protein ACNI3A_01260 [Desulfovibrio sp.]|uniref:tetratricopeptide repeat protein n=1 Tax=Desulfovibrio sp. 7SRBS1 TaxID=3378064 RepID=UPI003B41A7F2
MKSSFRKTIAVLAVLSCALLLAACAKKTRQASGIMDSPEHHYEVGQRALDDNNLQQAAEEFQLALELDPGFGPALAGKGLVSVMQGGDFDDGLSLVKNGLHKADGTQQKLAALTAEIRLYTEGLKRGEVSEYKALTEAKNAYRAGIHSDKGNLALSYYMGEAYLQALDFESAEKMFAAVKYSQRMEKAGIRFREKTDARWELLQKAKRAAPNSIVGKKIVLVDELSRADMAGLLVEELNVARFFGRTQTPEASTFQAPPSNQIVRKADTAPTDTEHHPLKADIDQVIEFGVQGLQQNPDGSFTPDMPLTKAEIAMIFQDIILRATGKDMLATEFIGQKSPFADVRNDQPYFNAVMVCTTRGLLEADKRSGLFKPGASVPGVDALLYIKELKAELNPF